MLEFRSPEASEKIEVRLAAWATLDMETLVHVHEAIGYMDNAFKELERAANAQLKNTGGGDIGEILAVLQSDLEEIVKAKNQ